MRRGARRWGWLAAGAVVVWGWVALEAGQDRPSEQGRDIWAADLPPGQGRELAAQRCSNCHTLERTVQLRRPRDGWEATVFDMVGRGAPIFLDEAKELVDYFSKVFGPDAPPFIDVNRASKNELIKVPGVTAELADRLLAYRGANGPIPSRDRIREILGVDEKAFESMRYYLHAAAPPPSGVPR